MKFLELYAINVALVWQGHSVEKTFFLLLQFTISGLLETVTNPVAECTEKKRGRESVSILAPGPGNGGEWDKNVSFPS